MPQQQSKSAPQWQDYVPQQQQPDEMPNQGWQDYDPYTADIQSGQMSPAVAARHARSTQGKDIQRGQPGTSFEAQHPIATGAAKGAANTLTGIGRLAGITPGPEAQTLTPEGDSEKLGKNLEQAGEFFMLPGGPEIAGAPGVVARMGVQAAGSGALNKLQGGSFTGGAALGAGTGALGEAGRALAPSIAESAIGIGRRDRGFGKSPGKALLSETSGIRPGTVADQAQDTIRNLTNELESRVANATQPASTRSAVGVVDSEMAKAARQNNAVRYNALQTIRDQLTKDFQTGAPIPPDVHPLQALDLKRGIGDLDNSWNPELRSGLRPVVRKVYAALDKEIDAAAPGTDQINQRISSLIPASQRAAGKELDPSMAQRMAHRVGVHTGAATAGILGAEEGYRHGGLGGMGVGALAGLAVPEIIASPTAQLAAARLARSGAPARFARALGSRGLPQLGSATNPAINIMPPEIR